MKLKTFKRASIAASLFLLGWAASIGYQSWRYDFDFSPWQKSNASVLPLTQAIFKQQCTSENDMLNREVIHGDKAIETFSAAWFGCLSERSDGLMRKLSFAVTGYSHMSCTQWAESEGRSGAECKKALDERMLMHRALKEPSAE